MPQKNHVIISQNIILLLGRNMEVILHHFFNLSSYCVSRIGSTASPDDRPGRNRGPGYYLLRQHDRRAPPWLGVRDVTDRNLRDTDVSTVTGRERM